MDKCLYIDDLREVPAGFTHCARTYEEALKMIQYEDWNFISFDHDLGSLIERENGLTLMNILEELVFNGVRKAPIINVHTANSAARPAMKQCAIKIESFIPL